MTFAVIVVQKLCHNSLKTKPAGVEPTGFVLFCLLDSDGERGAILDRDREAVVLVFG